MFKIKCFNAMSILSIMQTFDVRFRFCIPMWKSQSHYFTL